MKFCIDKSPRVFITALLVTLCFQESLAQQYYQGGYNPNNYGPPSQRQVQNNAFNENSVEQKYVNSGQSVMLVCDLPNNMPDGKVGSILLI